MPKENDVCTCSVPGAAVVNLFMAIWYKDKDFENFARTSAEKQLGKKSNLLSRSYISYLLAIMNRDIEDASHQLELICVGAKRSKEWGENDFTRGFAQLAHSMYNLLYYIYDGELADLINMPKADNFCQDLAIWQREHAHKEGKVRYIYPEMFDVMNKIMQCTPPRMYLKYDHRKKCIDTARFERDVVALVKERL